MPLLEYVLSGIKHFEAWGTTLGYISITIQVLTSLKPVWLSPFPHLDRIMLWATSCTVFFGFSEQGNLPSPPFIHTLPVSISVSVT